MDVNIEFQKFTNVTLINSHGNTGTWNIVRLKVLESLLRIVMLCGKKELFCVDTEMIILIGQMKKSEAKNLIELVCF